MPHLPCFLLPFFLLLAICFVLAARDDAAYGPHLRDREEQWTPRYRFLLHYMVRILFLGAFCTVMQAVSLLSLLVA